MDLNSSTRIEDIKPIPASPLEVEEFYHKILAQRHSECKGCMWHPNVCRYCANSLLDNIEGE